jgi:hypothetical protein
VDQETHPENSDDTRMELREAEREAKHREWMDRTGGSYHPTSAMGFTTAAGLTLQDYFAAQVLPTILRGEESLWDLSGDRCAQGRLAELAYELADAMIEARKAAPRG